MRYIFGNYDLDTQRYAFHHAGIPVRLEPQVFNVLAYLIRHRDRVVSKQELLDHLWPEQFISDATLHTRLMEARKAVGDSGRTQQVIQTLRGRGYRFVVEVEERDHDATDTQRQPSNVIPAAVDLAPSVSSDSIAINLPTGERKPVTVLCGTLAGASTLAERLGFEVLQPLRQAFVTQANQEVQRYGGIMQLFGDDGFLALFGVPVAQEDHARRAVLAALGLQRNLREDVNLRTPHTEQLTACLGLHTGLVMVGPREEHAPHTSMAMGETATLAVRLLTLADPGTILVSEPTMRQVQDTVDGDIFGRIDVLGQPEPIVIYTVREPVNPLMAWPGTRPVSRFVGRERELAMLHALLAQVEEGQGQITGIIGEPGMGKSRLLYEFRQCLADKQITCLEGQCVSYGRATPYLPLLDILRQRCGITHADSMEVVSAKVLQGLGDIGIDPDSDALYLLHLLGVCDDTEPLSRLSAQVIKARTFVALRQFLLHSSQQQPLIVMVENLHWIDATSEEWLTLLVEHLIGAPILLLTTYRPGYRPPWIDKSYATQLSLSRLTSPDSLAVIQSIPQANGIPEDVVEAILTRAAGNPFFLEELTRAVVESGTSDVPPQVPDTVQAVLAARIDRLPHAEKRLLQMAAVIGKDVPFSLLAAVVELPEEAFAHELLRLQTAEFLYETCHGTPRTYTFKHVLTQEAAYQTLPQSARQQMHQRIAQVLVDDFPVTVEAQPEVLAYHYTEAGLSIPAVDYWQQAGQRAIERSAHVEAIVHLLRGLELLRALPETSPHVQQELTLRLTLGTALRVTKGYGAAEVEKTYTRALELCQQVGTTTQHFQALFGLARCYVSHIKLQKARDLGEQCLVLARQTQVRTDLMEAHWVLGATLFYAGGFKAAWAHLKQGEHLYDPHQHRAYASRLGQDLGVVYRGVAVWVLAILGYPEQALRKADEALTLAQELAHPSSIAVVLNHVAQLYVLLRDWQTAQFYAETLIDFANEHGFASYAATGSVHLGSALVGQGQGEAGLALMHQARTGLQAAGMENMACWVDYMAEAYAKLGRTEEGLCLLAQALALVDNNGDCWHEAEMYRLRGELLWNAEDGRWGATWTPEACLHHALDIARRQQAKSFELRAAMSLAHLWQQQGKRQDAHDLLTSVYGWFTEGFDTADLRDAKALLSELKT
jgi:class 3 adenylate cyclase/tetratricopeptide (TPR) repeat protein